MSTFSSKLRIVFLLSLIAGAMLYFFWPRSQMGPPVFAQNLVQNTHLPAIYLPDDSLLDDMLRNKEALSSLQIDSMLALVPDSSELWMKARVYRSWLHLEKRAAGSARKLLESPLPDSNWQWIPSRHWYLALARTQTGKLSEALRVLDSVPASFSPERDSLKHILQSELKHPRPKEKEVSSYPLNPN